MSEFFEVLKHGLNAKTFIELAVLGGFLVAILHVCLILGAL